MKLLKDQKKLFSYIDSDFENWNVNEGVQVSGVKLETRILEKDSKFSDIFNPETDCISQEDVIKYCEKLEINKYSTFFLLMNSKKKFFVARADFGDGGGLRLGVRRLSCGGVWRASGRCRFVLPAKSLDSKIQTLNFSDSLTLEKAIDLLKSANYKIFKEI